MVAVAIAAPVAGGLRGTNACVSPDSWHRHLQRLERQPSIPVWLARFESDGLGETASQPTIYESACAPVGMAFAMHIPLARLDLPTGMKSR